MNYYSGKVTLTMIFSFIKGPCGNLMHKLITSAWA